MLRGKKIRLLPTPEQEILFCSGAGTSRWAYNYFLARNEEQYKTYLANGRKGKKSISEGVIRKEINNQLKPTTHQWLKEVGSNVMKQAVKEADRAMKKFLSGAAGRPKFKTKRRTTPRFYVNYESLTRKNGGFHGEKIGFVRTAEPLPKIPKGCHYSTPWISFDGKYWYIGFGYEVPDRLNVELTGDSIGIDLGVKELAVCYAFGERKKTVFKNINKTKEVHRLEKKLRREQRRQSRKFTANIDHYETVQRNEKRPGRRPIWKRPIRECRNLERQRQRIILLHRRLKNIRENHIHQTTAAIVKNKPSRIVMEDLNVKGMMKNRYLAKEIASEKFYEFRRQMEYKCEPYGIQLVFADSFYPSSKTCSHCGHIKKDLKLNNRTYICPACGHVIDRDLNAAINLAKYFKSEIA
ncbi:RNA-guided endonuclease InsQ/TnpB family protein [Mitsuokella jalaludinii]|uniref:RNA-guided endonuclease InsQ/TnpB family protein n=1 Tax=Mitsuokella jalaludinii TaxID=187979 RepID=UPI00242A49B3|nr:RNA-guided endonuclease TnpB family protein [Mitsuokella jalaludinii]